MTKTKNVSPWQQTYDRMTAVVKKAVESSALACPDESAQLYELECQYLVDKEKAQEPWVAQKQVVAALEAQLAEERQRLLRVEAACKKEMNRLSEEKFRKAKAVCEQITEKTLSVSKEFIAEAMNIMKEKGLLIECNTNYLLTVEHKMKQLQSKLAFLSKQNKISQANVQ